MIQRIVRKALWGLFFFAFFEKFFVPILTSGGLAAVSSSAFAALYSAFGKYDVVHIHAEGPAFFAWLPKMFGKRVVVTVHGIDWQREKWQSGLGSKFIHQGEKNAAKYADEVIVLSKGVQDYFKETWEKENKVRDYFQWHLFTTLVIPYYKDLFEDMGLAAQPLDKRDGLSCSEK